VINRAITFLIGKGAASGAFSPSDIPGLKMWLKADALSLSNNDPVTSWTDLSGQNNHATQSSAGAKPTFKNDGAFPVVRFNGTTNLLNIFDCSALNEAEIFIVLRVANDPPADVAQSGLWTFGTDTNRTHFPYLDGNVYEQFGTTARKSVGNPTPDLSSAFRIYNAYSADSDYQVSLDKTPIFSTSSNTVGFTSTPLLGQSMPFTFFEGDMREIVFFDHKLAGAQRTNMENYLQTT
jgi:hypothetical protein